MAGFLSGGKKVEPEANRTVSSEEVFAGNKVGRLARVCVTVKCVEVLEGGYEFAFEGLEDEHVIWEPFGSQSITWMGG